MLKKTGIASLVLTIIVISVLIIIMIPRTSIKNDSNASVVFKYLDNDIEEKFSSEDEIQIRDVFSNKILYKDRLSCGFNEDVSIRFDNTASDESLVFCIACDGCPKIFLVQSDKYFTISEKDRQNLDEILRRYGVTFPCV